MHIQNQPPAFTKLRRGKRREPIVGKRRDWNELLHAQWDRGHQLCVGLDSEFTKIPPTAHRRGRAGYVLNAQTVFGFNRTIVEATWDLVGAFKPNLAFYLDQGAAGVQALRNTVRFINKVAPEVPVILDAKVGDIGNTNSAYARFVFDRLGIDAVTVHNYLGQEAMQPFLNRPEKGVIVLAKTSNKGSGEFQNRDVGMTREEAEYLAAVGVPLVTRFGTSSTALCNLVAYQVMRHWNTNGNCALVVGATYPEELASIRAIAPEMPFLIPGIGTQGGDVEKTVKAGKSPTNQGMIINSSSGIIFAAKEGEDLGEVARRETLKLHYLIVSILAQVPEELGTN